MSVMENRNYKYIRSSFAAAAACCALFGSSIFAGPAKKSSPAKARKHFATKPILDETDPFAAAQWTSGLETSRIMESTAAEVAKKPKIDLNAIQIVNHSHPLAKNESKNPRGPKANSERGQSQALNFDAPAAEVDGQLRNYDNAKVLTRNSYRELKIFRAENLVTVDPSSVSLKLNERMKVGVVGSKGWVGLQIFVRDGGLLHWDARLQDLIPLAKGSTELFVVANGKMQIVPITIGDSPESKINLIPDALVDITERILGRSLGSRQEVSEFKSESQGTASDSISFSESVSQVARTRAQTNVENSKIEWSSAPNFSEPTDFIVQFVDERSKPRVGEVYPVSQLNVKISGADLPMVTDKLGYLHLKGVPAESRFLLTYSDGSGNIHAGAAEISTDSVRNGEVVRVVVLRTSTFDLLSQIAESTQESNLASLCVRIESRSGALVADSSVTLDVSASGPHYFNNLGYLDPSAKRTGNNGRACFFNINPGPVSVEVTSSGTRQMYSFGVFPGFHREESIVVDDLAVVGGVIASKPAVYEFSDSESTAKNPTLIDGSRILDFAGNEFSMHPQDSQVLYRQGVSLFKNKTWVASGGGGEFEDSIHQLGSFSRRPDVITLLPRGFIDDLARIAQLDQDPNLGVVLVEHTPSPTWRRSSVVINLINHLGRQIGDPWYSNGSQVSRAAFFNVRPGQHVVTIDTQDGFWLGSESVLAYSGAVTVVNLGLRPFYQSPNVQP